MTGVSVTTWSPVTTYASTVFHCIKVKYTMKHVASPTFSLLMQVTRQCVSVYVRDAIERTIENTLTLISCHERCVHLLINSIQ